MKVAIAVVLGIVLLGTLLTTVLGGDEENCGPDGAPSAAGGVPAGQYSKPTKEGTASISSGYRSPDRPDHRGIDFAGPVGTPIYAFADGVVEQSGPASGFGNWIVLNHQIDGKTYSTVYGHMFDDGLLVKAGDTVKAGQHIAKIGNAGGSTGPHLHFEVWDGGRNTGGHDVDPTPWIDKAVEPGSGDGAGAPSPSKPAPEAVAAPTSAVPSSSAENPPSDGDLRPSPKLKEDHLQVDTIRVGRAVAEKFPAVQQIGGWRPSDPFPDHPDGRAIDVMIPNYDTDAGRKLGDEVKDYLYANRDAFHIEYMIWRQQYIPSKGEGNTMPDRGDPTQNHFDHVHVTVAGGGMPKPGQGFGSAPEGGGSTGSSADDCQHPAGAGRALADGEIPEELRKWIKLGGQVCPEVDSPLLAGLLYHESAGFNAHAVSPVGAQGYGQFMPGTWAGAGAKVDENGKVAGPPGSGSPNDPADASMAAARYLCQIAANQKPKIASGQIKGDPQALMLAGYNAGEGNVDQYGGVPPFAETQKYVVVVPQEASRFVGTAGT